MYLVSKMPSLKLVIIFMCVLQVICRNESSSKSETEGAAEDEDKDTGIVNFFSANYDKALERTLCMFYVYIILASLIKVGYHQSSFLTNNIPESCVLIMTGLGFGTFFKILETTIKFPAFSVHLFFYGLLPPIILESAHQLHDQVFFNNMVTVVMYAVIGTLINVFLIGLSLYMFVIFAFDFLNFPQISLIEMLIFSNAISAVDPVTVLAIFQDLRVNKPLYYLVFGESLLNDAVVIALHDLLCTFISTPFITSGHILRGIGRFFYGSVGGFIIGIVFGLITAIMTLYTKHSEVIEPMLMIGTAYLSYITADIFGTSGLISLVGCGLVQFEFANRNVTAKTNTTVKYFIKTLSSVTEMMIFFFLGQCLINMDPDWSYSFVILTIIFCLLYRVVSVFSLTFISNNYFHRTRQINLEEQALMAYGGLRGAVAFAMIALLEEVKEAKHVPLFKTTTLVIILFTVFILGGSTKPLLNFLRIQKETIGNKKLCFIINDKITHTVINGIETFVGNISTMNFLTHKFKELIQYLKKYISKGSDSKIEADIKKLERHETRHESHDSDDKNAASPESKINSAEDFLKQLEMMAKDVIKEQDTFTNILPTKVAKNIFSIDNVVRNHHLPHDLSSKVLNAKEKYKSDNKKLYALRSDMNTQEIRKGFQKKIEDIIAPEDKQN